MTPALRAGVQLAGRVVASYAVVMAATPPLIVEATREFLRRHAPFNRMDDDAFAFLIPRLKLAYFAHGATILAPRSGVVGDLHVIQSGRVGSHPDNVQADPDPTLGPGELFPVGALSAGGTTTKIFHAVEDTFCYLLARDDFIELQADLGRVRALLRAGRHRDAEAVAGNTPCPIQPARRGAAGADPHARRARAARAGGRRGDRSDKGRARAHVGSQGADGHCTRRRRRACRHVHAGRSPSPRRPARAAARHSGARRSCPRPS